MKKIVTLLTAASLIAGSTITVSAATIFEDIKNVPWPSAADFINEAAELGLMNGYTEDGKKYCKPKNPVTYCEATQLMYSIMKTYYQEDVTTTTIDKWKPIMTAYNIPSWAHPAVAFSLERGILVTNDLQKFMNGNTQQNANREDVGVIFGKALGKIHSVDMNATLSYNDKAKISSDAVPYIDLLYDQKIMVGDDYNNFNPDANINRSEMAVLSVKTYKHVLNDDGTPNTPTEAQKTVSGTLLTSVVLTSGDLFCIIKSSSGETVSLTGKRTSAKAYDNGKEIAFSQLAVGDAVTATYIGSALQVINRSQSVDTSTEKGTFELYDIYGQKVTVLDDDDKKVTYPLSDTATIYIDDIVASPAALYNDFEDGTKFTVKLFTNTAGELTKVYATTIVNMPKTGLLTDLEENELKLKYDAKTYTYDVSDKVTVSDDFTECDFDDLMDRFDDTDFYITVTTDAKNIVTKITVNYAEDEENGVLTDMTSRRLTIETQGHSYTYEYDEDADVTIDGKNKDMSDLYATYEDISYRVSLVLDRDDEVTDVVAISENKTVPLTEGIIVELSSSKIEIENDDNKSYSYDLADDLTVTLNGASSTLSALRDVYDDYDYKATLTFKNGEVSKIVAVNTQANEGQLRSIDEDEIQIVLDGSKFTYDIANDVTVTGDADDLDDLIDQFNDYEDFYVELTFNNSRTKVTKIVAEYDDGKSDTSNKGRLTDIGKDWIEVDNKDYDISSDVRVYIDKGRVDFAELQEAFDDGDDFDVVLTLDSRDVVTQIEATER